MAGAVQLQKQLQRAGKWSALWCFLAGAAMALCFAPFHLWPIAFLSLPLFYLLLESAPSRGAAAWRGFFFGYGYFTAGTWWIANAMLVDVAHFGWLIPLTIFGLSAVFALWFLLFGFAVWTLRTGEPLADLLRFAVLWVLTEYARSLGMFGFPWNLAGYIAEASHDIMQIASLGGIYGLSFFVVLVALVPVAWVKSNFNTGARVLLTVVAALLFVAAFAYGAMRVPKSFALTGERVRVVQPAIPEAVKWTEQGRIESLRLHSQLSRMKTSLPTPPILIWSETALPFTMYPDSLWPDRLKSLVPPGGMLITGVVRADDTGSTLKLWNGLVAIDEHGAVRGGYDKHQLVPFGEFVPGRAVLPLDKITPGDTDFSRGPGPQTITVDDVPDFSPLICYEAIFPDIAVKREKRPKWLLNITNDAWYGRSPGPFQHFAMARMRSVEQGLPLVRAANNGISAVIDPYGRIVRALPLDARGIMDEALPEPLAPTLYARYGERITLILLLAAWCLAWVSLQVRKI